MAIGLAVIMGGMGAIIAMIIGILIFSSITESIDCDSISEFGGSKMMEQCEKSMSTLWIVIGILPIALFFAMFHIFGGLSGGSDEDDDDNKTTVYNRAKPTETKKERQKRKQTQVDLELAQYDDKVVHSFLTNWFRRSKN